MNKEEIVNKLFNNQLKNVDHKYRLNTKDIIRLSSYINSDPFSETDCCKWRGAISKSTHQSKYINFWFNKKKQALHRILYLNYKGELQKNKYLKFTCQNPNMRGICCNINHIILINENDDEDNNEIKKETKDNKLNSDSSDKIELTQDQINKLQLSEAQLNQLNQLKQNQQKLKQNKQEQEQEQNKSKQTDDYDLDQINKTAKGKKSKKNDDIEQNNNLIIKTTKNCHNSNRFIIVFDD